MLLFRKRRLAIAADMRARLGEDNILVIEDGANCFGIESRGKGQVRGNGVLAATDEVLLFVMWMPKREFTIPRDRITGIERVKSHLGKSMFRDLLKVRFTNDEGNPDSVAWWVRDLAGWESVLQAQDA